MNVLKMEAVGWRYAAREIAQEDVEWARRLLTERRVRPELKVALGRELERARSQQANRG